MKCPYVVNQQTITKTNIEYNEDGQQKAYIEFQNNKSEFVDCLEKDCEAFYDGRCHYKN